jgi:hypothetical protein
MDSFEPPFHVATAMKTMAGFSLPQPWSVVWDPMGGVAAWRGPWFVEPGEAAAPTGAPGLPVPEPMHPVKVLPTKMSGRRKKNFIR